MRRRGNWRPYVRVDNTIRDFRPVARYWMHGGETAAPFLQENEQYAYDAVAGTGTQYQVAKYGKLFGITWEAIINDDLGLLRDFPDRLAESATNTEDAFVTRLYCGPGGPLRGRPYSTDGWRGPTTNSDYPTIFANMPPAPRRRADGGYQPMPTSSRPDAAFGTPEQLQVLAGRLPRRHPADADAGDPGGWRQPADRRRSPAPRHPPIPGASRPPPLLGAGDSPARNQRRPGRVRRDANRRITNTS